MAPAKLPNSRPRASPRIACYGTAFLADAPIDAKLLMRGIGADVPQFSTPRLDASFLANCGSFMSRKTAIIDDPRAYFKRLAGTDFRLGKSKVLYECSTKLCALLTSLSEQRAVEIATEWYGMSGPPKTKPAEPNGRTQRRLTILNNLAALARQAKFGQMKLMLRVDYRKQR
jgi:hypothetical protein